MEPAQCRVPNARRQLQVPDQAICGLAHPGLTDATAATSSRRASSPMLKGLCDVSCWPADPQFDCSAATHLCARAFRLSILLQSRSQEAPDNKHDDGPRDRTDKACPFAGAIPAKSLSEVRRPNIRRSDFEDLAGGKYPSSIAKRRFQLWNKKGPLG